MSNLSLPLNHVLEGESQALLSTFPENSFHALVTDPPAGISFMNLAFDSDKGGRDQWIAWLTTLLREAWRCCRPGAHALVWALPRTAHWTATALEDAGWEIRDVLMHLFGNGWPKSRTALKPAAEHWLLCRKPLSEPTIAENVRRWGTGVLNIDACRIAGQSWGHRPPRTPNAVYGNGKGTDLTASSAHQGGRWPAHLLLSHTIFCGEEECSPDCPIREIDQQSGQSSSRKGKRPASFGATPGVHAGWRRPAHASYQEKSEETGYQDHGGASRYFQQFASLSESEEDEVVTPFLYCAKASSRERNQGCEQLPKQDVDRYGACGQGNTPQQTPRITRHEGNHHSTVKPIALMRWLVRLVTPPGGIVLDCFGGSGTTALACLEEGRPFVLIERESEYVRIARARIAFLLSHSSTPCA